MLQNNNFFIFFVIFVYKNAILFFDLNKFFLYFLIKKKKILSYGFGEECKIKLKEDISNN